ncbi:MAG: HAD family hydrolase [Desulfobulbaceae bacterium]|nr:HAD family hydrolase [Desulfobulbaceae bacterium]
MPKLQVVIFDCDGVMFDSIAANKSYYNHLLAHFGHPPMDEEELRYVHVHHVMDSVRHIFRHHPQDLEQADLYRKSVDYTPFLQHMTMEPDLRQFLDFLAPRYQAAISTNRTTTMAGILKLFELEPYFTMVVTAGDVANPKPHPEALQRILAHCQCSAAEAIYIGDSMVDREHTASIGMRLIAFKNPQLPAEYHVTSFMEIPSLPIFKG